MSIQAAFQKVAKFHEVSRKDAAQVNVDGIAMDGHTYLGIRFGFKSDPPASQDSDIVLFDNSQYGHDPKNLFTIKHMNVGYFATEQPVYFFADRRQKFIMIAKNTDTFLYKDVSFWPVPDSVDMNAALLAVLTHYNNIKNLRNSDSQDPNLILQKLHFLGVDLTDFVRHSMREKSFSGAKDERLFHFLSDCVDAVIRPVSQKKDSDSDNSVSWQWKVNQSGGLDVFNEKSSFTLDDSGIILSHTGVTPENTASILSRAMLLSNDKKHFAGIHHGSFKAPFNEYSTAPEAIDVLTPFKQNNNTDIVNKSRGFQGLIFDWLERSGIDNVRQLAKEGIINLKKISGSKDPADYMPGEPIEGELYFDVTRCLRLRNIDFNQHPEAVFIRQGDSTFPVNLLIYDAVNNAVISLRKMSNVTSNLPDGSSGVANIKYKVFTFNANNKVELDKLLSRQLFNATRAIDFKWPLKFAGNIGKFIGEVPDSVNPLLESQLMSQIYLKAMHETAEMTHYHRGLIDFKSGSLSERLISDYSVRWEASEGGAFIKLVDPYGKDCASYYCDFEQYYADGAQPVHFISETKWNDVFLDKFNDEMIFHIWVNMNMLGESEGRLVHEDAVELKMDTANRP